MNLSGTTAKLGYLNVLIKTRKIYRNAQLNKKSPSVIVWRQTVKKIKLRNTQEQVFGIKVMIPLRVLHFILECSGSSPGSTPRFLLNVYFARQQVIVQMPKAFLTHTAGED